MVMRGWTREEAIAMLETPERRASQNPEEVWRRVGLRPGEIVADVGAGTGFFALPAAAQVGPTGRVYAIDLSADLVDLLHTRRDRESLPQLYPIRNTVSSIPLPSAMADVVLLANVLHDFPPSTITEAVRLLKPEGRLINIDWKAQPTPMGPPLSIRLTPDEAARLLGKRGLAEVDRWEFGPWHYGLVLRRSPRGRSSPTRKRAKARVPPRRSRTRSNHAANR
jgi:ubiquinone/menaquinone biosynthesis C-methylase UbiE